MKKTLFFILSFYVLRFTYYASPVFALDPIVIQEAIHLAPPPQADPNKQKNYFSNDTAENGTKCEKVVKISNTFAPHLTSPNVTPGQGSGQAAAEGTYKPYFVDEIKQVIKFGKEPISNTSSSWLNRQIANRYTGTLSMSDPSTIQKAFTNFDATKGSASNATTRGLPYTTLKCLKGKRLMAATEYNSDPHANLVFNNEAIACYRGVGTFQLLPDASVKCPRGSVITLSDLTHFLAIDPSYSPEVGIVRPDGTIDNTQCGKSDIPYKYFYPSGASCNTTTVPMDSVYPPSTKATYNLTGAEACYLFKHVVRAVDVGSNAQRVRICNTDNITHTEDCTNEDRSLPMGNQFANTDLARWTIPSTQEVKPVDICATQENVSDVHKSNEFDILAFIKDAFGWVKDTTQVFTGPIRVITKTDTRLVEGIAKDTTFTNNLLYQEQQDRYGTTTSSKASSNNNRDIDPGDPLSRFVLNENILPSNFF